MNCLFHNEKTPSMAIYPAHYFCYSCGVHGDIFELVQKIYDITFADSIKILEEYEKEKKEMSTPVGD
jgi:DNA primase